MSYRILYSEGPGFCLRNGGSCYIGDQDYSVKNVLPRLIMLSRSTVLPWNPNFIQKYYHIYVYGGRTSLGCLYAVLAASVTVSLVALLNKPTTIPYIYFRFCTLFYRNGMSVDL